MTVGTAPVATPSLASPALPVENMSGHTKKLRFLLEHLDRRLGESAGSTIELLDFGCGNGSAVSRFLMLPRVRYRGVDIHPASLAYARERYGGEGASFSTTVPEGVSFDVLVYADILEHLEDPEGLLREHASRHVRGGLLLGSVPNGFGAFENEKRLDRWLKISALLDLPARVKRSLGRVPPKDAGALPYNAESGHVRFFTRRALLAALDQAGYRVFDFRNGAFLGAPTSERYLLRGRRLAEWSARVADHVPHWAASTWLFAAVKER
jgi:SAM-dependent methyltransferase